MEEQVCELCLKASMETFPILEDYLKDVVGDISLKSMLKVPQQQNIVCNECQNNLRIFYNFKMTFVHFVNTTIQRDDCKSNTSLNLGTENKLIIKSEDDVKNMMTCRFCTKTLTNPQVVPLNEAKKNSYVVNLLNKHIPELDLNVIEHILCCESCHEPLQGLLSFITKCFNVEEKLRKYTEMVEAGSNDKIHLNRLQEFTFNSTLKQDSACRKRKIENVEEESEGDQKPFPIKSEPEFEWGDRNDLESVIKHEEVDIKSEDDSSDGYNEDMKQRVLTHKDDTERNMCDSIISACEAPSRTTKRQHTLICKDSSNSILFKCELCIYTTKYCRNLKTHMEIHKDPSQRKKHKCSDCDYESLSASCLKVHTLTHNDPLERRRYTCNDCGFETLAKIYLCRHILIHKETSERIEYKCNDCAYSTLYKRYLKRHKLIHKDPSERKIYRCNNCYYETYDKGNLIKHILTHKDRSKRKTHKCEHCAFDTYDKSYLRRHILTHKDPSEKIEYKCNDCAYSTFNKRNLKRHILIHKDPSERKNYRCNNCNYETYDKGSLIKHILTHKDRSERKTYKCEHCAFDTVVKSNLRRHILTHKFLQKGKSTNVMTEPMRRSPNNLLAVCVDA